MIIVMASTATEADIQNVVRRVGELGLKAQVSQGEERVIIGVIGDERSLQRERLSLLPKVENVIPVLKPYKLASRDYQREYFTSAPGELTLGPVVVAPDRTKQGTNLLLRRPVRAIPARFGSGSLPKHMAAAETKELPVATVDRPELSFDLDLPVDIVTLIESGAPGKTRDTLLEMDAATRVAQVS